MSDSKRAKPAELTRSWPDSESSDAAGELARQIVLNLRVAMGATSVRGVARAAELDEATVRKVLAGDVWPDIRTVARLEQALGAPLYPR